MQTYRTNPLISPGFFIKLATAILLLPAHWVCAWFFAAAFHELCHYVALRFCGVQILAMRIGFSGAIIETEPMHPKNELISSLAGPFGGLLLLLLLRVSPRIAICALLLSLFNLLPFYPFDGGRAFFSLISCFRLYKQQKNSLQTSKSNSTITNNVQYR